MIIFFIVTIIIFVNEYQKEYKANFFIRGLDAQVKKRNLILYEYKWALFIPSHFFQSLSSSPLKTTANKVPFYTSATPTNLRSL